MAPEFWPTKVLSVASLHLDSKNPRLGRETTARAPRDIIQYLFDHDKSLDVARSIGTRGYFPNEPLLAIKEGGRYVVVEGNRRLAALKALREPGLLEGSAQAAVERVARQMGSVESIASVPVTIAPDRRATDRLIAGRHIGTPVLPWQAENRASFILDKLDEGYDNDELRDLLGFSITDIQEARQTRAIADMARSLDLPDEVKAKLDTPRAKLFTTLERVFQSSVGREFLHVVPDPEHGIRGTTTKNEFVRALTRLVTDIALGKASSRTLNTNENIRTYFTAWPASERAQKKQGSFVPADVISGRSVASSPGKTSQPPAPAKRTKRASLTVLPSDFRIQNGNERLVDMRRELVRLRRDAFPNAGAVLLRVFLELAVLDYLKRTGELDTLIDTLKKKNVPIPFGVPTMKQLAPFITAIAKKKLSSADGTRVEKALRYDAAAPFTLSDMHAFVHQAGDLPSARDIHQFWLRTEPLFRMMLQDELPKGTK